MKKIYAIILMFSIRCSMFNVQSFSQSIPPFEWAKNIMIIPHGSMLSANYPRAICTDDHANNYTTGFFRDSILIDTAYLHTPSFHNTFILSYDSSGNFRWAKKITSFMENDPSGGIVYDHAGNIYVSGYFEDSITFDAITYNSFAGRNSYIARYDTSGNFQWAKIFFTNGNLSNIHSIFADNSGNLYAAGTYTDSLLIDSTNMNLAAGNNFYFVKFNSAGVMQLVQSGFATYPSNLRITSDPQNSIYLTGTFNGSVSILSASASGRGSFVAKIFSAGTVSWINVISGNPAIVTGIKATASGQFYAGGLYNDSISFGATTFYTPTLPHNVFTAQYDSSGLFHWAKRIDVSMNNQIQQHDLAASNNYVYVTGEFTYSLVFNGINYSGNGPSRDVYVAAYDNTGNEVWFKKAGGNSEDYSYGIDKDAAENLYTATAVRCPGYFDSITITDTTAGPLAVNSTALAKINVNSILSIFNQDNNNNYFTIFPNPLTTQSKLTFKNPNKEKFLFALYDIPGRITGSVSTTNNEIILTKGNKQPGVYLFNLMNEKTGERKNGKIVIAD